MTEKNLEILNLVHKLAALSNNYPPSCSPSLFSTAGSSFQSTNNIYGTPSSSQPFGLQNQNSNANRISFKKGNNGSATGSRRIQPMSVPRRPPDIQNIALFPTLGESCIGNSQNKRHSFPPESIKQTSTLTTIELSPNEQKLKKLESKFRGQNSNALNENGISFSTPQRTENKIKPKRIIIPPTTLAVKSQSENNFESRPKEGARKVPRSAELFAELTLPVITEVDEIAEQYSSLIDNNLCLSVLEEISFLLQLIGSGKGGNSGKINQKLSSLAQQVYFVIKVLSLQLNSTLICVDPLIIQTLVQKYPHRIPKPVRKHLESWVEDQLKRKTELHLAEIAKSPLLSVSNKPSEFHQCVTFHSETDGRANFPSQGDFHAFCKQRDLFYTIKNLWKDKEDKEGTLQKEQDIKILSTTSTSSRNASLNRTIVTREPDQIYSKIKALFHINSCWANLSHFAALFTSQFILDSVDEEQSQGRKGRNSLDGNTQLKDEKMRTIMESNPDKFAKLHNRMSVGSQNEKNHKDCLAFSKYFLNVASSPAFNQHLIDRLTFEITQIETSLENAVNFPSKEITLLLKKTILMSQLLGYKTFLPYTNDESLNRPGNGNKATATIEKETLISSQAQLRSYQRPPLDLETTLKISIKQKRLTFTLPWIIEFLLASTDAVSLQLPSYKRVITLISSIYRLYLKFDSNNKRISLRNINFLRFWCGKLFSSDKVPQQLVFQQEQKVLKEWDSSESISLEDDETPLDLCDKIAEDLTAVYFASKFSQMKFILQAGLEQQQENTVIGFTSNNSTEPKHIRPVPADSNKTNKIMTKQVQLQLQLESSFFDSYPPSVKKTVDFIAERIASNYVKKLRSIVPKLRCDLALKELFEDEAAAQCKLLMFQGLDEFSKDKCVDAVNILIGEWSVTSSALKICQGIANRKYIEKVAEWIQNHIKAEMFPVIPPEDIAVLQKKQSELVTETESKITNQEVTENARDSFESFEPTFGTMIQLHRSLKKLHKNKTMSEEQIDELLFSKSLKTCCISVSTSVIDFGIALVAYVPQILTSKRQDRLISLWKKNWSLDYKIICPRNLSIIQKNVSAGSEFSNEEKSWKVLTEIVTKLIKEEMISLETLEQDCFRLLRQNWPPVMSLHVSQFLKQIVSSSKRSTVENEESREVIDWIAWYCSSDQPEG